MQKLAALAILTAACGFAQNAARAGGEAVERREFKQSLIYPYVFRPVCYLATQGPVPMRFEVSGRENYERKAPKLPAAQKLPPSTPIPDPVSIPAPVTTAAPAFPPPVNAPEPTKTASVDFTKFPAELVDLFKKQREGADVRNYLFDPLFLPAVPDDLPKSKATHEQK